MIVFVKGYQLFLNGGCATENRNYPRWKEPSLFGKSKKSCKNLVLRRRKFTRIFASLARIAPLKGGRKNFFVWYKYYNIGARDEYPNV